jgi:hypothetical protein
MSKHHFKDLLQKPYLKIRLRKLGMESPLNDLVVKFCLLFSSLKKTKDFEKGFFRDSLHRLLKEKVVFLMSQDFKTFFKSDSYL